MTADKDRLSDDDISALYQRGSDELPPAHLDDAIRAAARREVSPTPKSLSPFAGNWKVPLSLAALLVLSSSLVILMESRQQGLTSGGDIVLDNNRIISEVSVDPGRQREADSLASETRQDSQEREGVPRRQLMQRTLARPAIPASKAEVKKKRREDMDRDSTDPSGIRGLTAADIASEIVDEGAVMNLASTPPAIHAGAPQGAAANVEQYSFDSPEQWLKAIDKLLQQKNTSQARNSLEAFVRKYPQYRLTAKYRRILASQ